MALGPDIRALDRTQDIARERTDEGLRQYMLRVYNYMTTGLALSGVAAYAVASTQSVYNAIFGTPLMWVVFLAPLGLVFFLSARINSMGVRTAQVSFIAFSAIMGISLASLFQVYTGASITRVFFISAGTFAAMSIYGYTTKRDLTRLGSFLFMGLIGIVIATVVNLFVASSLLHFAISAIGVLIFVGLTAYDTQRIRQVYDEVEGADNLERASIIGGLRLYLDFLNLFIFLMQLLGSRR